MEYKEAFESRKLFEYYSTTVQKMNSANQMSEVSTVKGQCYICYVCRR